MKAQRQIADQGAFPNCQSKARRAARRGLVLTELAALLVLGHGAGVPVQAGSPYPYSTYITGIYFDYSSTQHYSIKVGTDGSDKWPSTWGSDDNIYVAW